MVIGVRVGPCREIRSIVRYAGQDVLGLRPLETRSGRFPKTDVFPGFCRSTDDILAGRFSKGSGENPDNLSDVRSATDDLLSDRPDLEGAIRDLLEKQGEGDPWTFDDVTVDSGKFGEIVSRGIVEKHEGGYQVTDPEAVRAALEGDETWSSDAMAEAETPAFADRLELDRAVAGGILAAVSVAVLGRIVFVYSGVFRDGDVVLTRNDPYFYRYWIDTLLASDLSAFSIRALGELPSVVGSGNELPLILVTWWATALLGGGEYVSGLVLAWYPVLAGLVVAVGTYLVATRVSKDRRAGIAAVLVMAVTPISVHRLGLGYADHHAFDMIWLVLALVCLTRLADDERSFRGIADLRALPRTLWLAVGGLGLAIGLQVLSWRGGVLLVAPVALYVPLRGIAAVTRGRSPILANLPLVGALGLGAVVAMVPHVSWGWAPTTQVAVPGALLGGAIAVLVGAEVAHRHGWGMSETVAAELVAGGVVLLAAWVLVPGLSGGFEQIVGYFQSFEGSEITETIPLIGPETAVYWGLIYNFGFVPFLVLPYIGWGVWVVTQDDQPLGALPVSAYALVTVGLALLQFRFALAMSIPMSVLGGIGILHIGAEVVDIRPPNVFRKATVNRWRQDGSWEALRSFGRPERRTVVVLAALFLAVTSFSVLTTTVATGDIPIEERDYRTATAIEADAAAWDLDYPANYVLSEWGLNRMYNYFVNGQAQSYGFARNAYEPFLSATNESQAYDRVSGRVGYVVTKGEFSARPDAMQVRLHEHDGSRFDRADGLGHYRVVHVSEDGTRKAFAVVPGATLHGTGPANANTTVRTTADVSGRTVRYVRVVRTDETGAWTLTVSYPGTYEVFGETYRVSEQQVRTGATVTS